MNLLAIETSTEFCSLAVCRDNVVSATHFPAAQRHGETVLEAVRALLAQAGLTLQDLDGIAFGHGPGSFTGLRIACGVTQGLALAFAIPVKGVSTLLALAEEVRYGSGGGRGHDKVIACLDARMGEVYHAACVRAADAPGWQVVAQPGLYQPEAVPVPDGAGWTACGTGFGIHGEALARRLGGDSRIIATLPGAVPTARAVLALARPQFEAGAGD
ncbi:MAG: tRNA (adenosine(37)-N6)-threonylcarbamoyltransferase complex dimerization subunit type 1 TsaB, partial [Betaproteobacteria bacterium]|nr:tRNA (adenosine(37)-N6)-threonylcarbamoyltransferase complex dimerization subunit type 1 TsaB [Betaproteobacteria bacterium]